jgi:hypothetical protein
MVQICLGTRRRGRTDADRRMLGRALWVHNRRLAVALAVVAAVALLALAVPRQRTPLEVFLDRSAPAEARLGAIPRLPLDDEGAMARVLWGVRGETDPALVGPALTGLADRVAAGPVPPDGRASFVALLQGLLADSGLAPDVHRAAFEALTRVGTAGEVLAGVLGYLRPDSPRPLEGQFLRYLRESPAAAAAFRGNDDKAVRARDDLTKLLPALAQHRTGEPRAEPLRLFVEMVSLPAALDVLAAQYRAAPDAELADLLVACLGRLGLAGLPAEARPSAVWQLAELLRDPGVEDRVKAAAVTALDGVEVGPLCQQLFEVYTRGKGTKGTDGRGTAPDPDESAKVILMPYAERTTAARVRGIQAYVLERLAALAAQRVEDQIPTSEELPYLVQAVGLLRQRAAEPWPAGLGALANLLANHHDLEDGSVRPLLLTALAAFVTDGPLDLAPVRDILRSRGMTVQARTAAAQALGEWHDAGGVDALKAVAAGAKNDRRLRLAALEALGRVGGHLRQEGQPAGAVADFLQGVLERRGDEADERLLAAALTAFGAVVDPSRVKVVFDLLVVQAYSFPAVAVAEGLMLRSDDDCRAVTRAYLEWRAGKPADLGKGTWVPPDELLTGGADWRSRKGAGAEKAMRVVAVTLAEAGADESPAVREVAARLGRQLVPAAPWFDPAAGAEARANQREQWKAWWGKNAGDLRLGPRGLTSPP